MHHSRLAHTNNHLNQLTPTLITLYSIINHYFEAYNKQTCSIKARSKQPNTTGGSSDVDKFPLSCSSKTT